MGQNNARSTIPNRRPQPTNTTNVQQRPASAPKGAPVSGVDPGWRAQQAKARQELLQHTQNFLNPVKQVTSKTEKPEGEDVSKPTAESKESKEEKPSDGSDANSAK